MFVRSPAEEEEEEEAGEQEKSNEQERLLLMLHPGREVCGKWEQRLQLDVASLVAAVAQLPRRFNFEFAFPSKRSEQNFCFRHKSQNCNKLRL